MGRSLADFLGDRIEDDARVALAHRDVEEASAKRRILSLWRNAWVAVQGTSPPSMAILEDGAEEALWEVLLELVEIYRDHPDFSTSWVKSHETGRS